MPDPPATAPLRRRPRQARGEARIAQLLDAAAAVIADVGVEAATTNAIAARAAASVGSLYQFFPDKAAIVEALAQRHAVAFDAVKDEVMSPAHALEPLELLIGRIVGAIAGWCDRHPAYPALYEHTTAHGVGRDGGVLHDGVVRQVERMLAIRYPALPARERDAVARVQVQSVHGIVLYSLRLPPRTRAAVRAELVRMLVAGLAALDTAHGHVARPVPSPRARARGRPRS